MTNLSRKAEKQNLNRNSQISNASTNVKNAIKAKPNRSENRI